MNTAKKQSTHAITQFELTKDLLQNLNKFNLSPIGKLVLLELSTHYNNKKESAVVFPSMNHISEVLGVSLTSVKQAINDLIKEGLIIKSKRDKIKGNYNKYVLTLKVQNTTVEKAEIESFKQPENNLFFDRTKKEKINKQQNGDKYLFHYASKMGVKETNKVAYINAIKRNGGAENIINEYKQIESKKKYMANQVKSFIKECEYAKENAVPPTREWKELKQKLLKLKNN